MPQMDSVTFLPQVFWLLVVFSTFYLIVAAKVLPTLSRILKTRAKKLSQGTDFTKTSTTESDALTKELSDTFVSSSTETLNSLQNLQGNTALWQKSQAKSLKGAGQQSHKNFNLYYFNVLSTFIANKTRYPSLVRLGI